MRLWLIPVRNGLPAVQQALDDPSQELAAVAAPLQIQSLIANLKSLILIPILSRGTFAAR